jgi:hypothetical protein
LQLFVVKDDFLQFQTAFHDRTGYHPTVQVDTIDEFTAEAKGEISISGVLSFLSAQPFAEVQRFGHLQDAALVVSEKADQLAQSTGPFCVTEEDVHETLLSLFRSLAVKDDAGREN